VSFYYPGTTLSNLGVTSIRVLVSGAGRYPTVVTQVGLALSFTGANHALPTSGISRYRLVPAGAGLKLQRLTTAWADVAGYTALPLQADFNNVSTSVVRLARSDGQFNDYRGVLGGYNNGGGVWAINRVSLDQYTQGVVPRESPASWRAAALQAQAIAARTYGRNAVESHTGSAYDICDTTSCQVYGGLARLSAGGTRLFGEEPSTNAATAATANQVLRYNGATIFAQFSASNGGWTSYGGYPYLPHKADPYDNAASGDPYLNWTQSVSVSSIASSFGLSRATRIEITQREGGGMWGGRVLQAYVDGFYPNGNAAHISMSIDTMRFLFGGGRSNWFDIVSPGGGDQLPPNGGGSIVAATSTSVQAAWVTAGGHLIFRQWTAGTGWAPEADLGTPPGETLKWDASLASWGSGHLDLAVVDSHNHLVTRAYAPDAGWSAWRPTSIVAASSPAAVDPIVGQLDIYYKGTDSRQYHVGWKQSGGWSVPVALPGIASVASGPAVVAPVSGTTREVLTYRDSAGVLWIATYIPRRGWTSPSRVNPGRAVPSMTAVDPGIDGNGATNYSVYITGSDGTVYHSGFASSSSAWSPWWAVPGQGVTSSVSAWNTASGVTLFAQYQGAPATQAWNRASGWRTWIPV
jgi:hypothetical protein